APDDLGLPGLLTTSQSFGVNLEALPDTPPGKPPLGRVNLLFVGIDWERKGGDIAVAALDELRALGVNAVLTIVGRCPVRHRGHPAIRAMGFLNKNRARDAARMRALYREAHLLLLPSRADCTPMVVAEAMAHGTPVLASEVGGIPEQIGGDGAGQVLPLFTSPAEWARTIAAMTVPDRYAWMSDAAFDRAQSQLNWDVWATRIADLARRAAQGHVPLPLERGTNAALAQN
ncbi:MAG: glycosyltransferase family 4 protein, partial [Maritimibacter sp.]